MVWNTEHLRQPEKNVDCLCHWKTDLHKILEDQTYTKNRELEITDVEQIYHHKQYNA